jgi:hypothetical protein
MAAAVLAVLGAGTWLALGGERASPEAAIARGVRALTAQRGQVEQHSLFVPAYLGRRYGFEALARFVDDFDPQSAAFAKQPTVNRMFAHAYDRGQRVERIELEDQHPIAELLYPALHCDYLPLPPTFTARVERALGTGGYETSHAVLALGFIAERGCTLGALSALRERGARALERELRAAREASDLNMELCALLGYLGQSERIEPRWRELVMTAQRDDGGWGYAGADRANWHHTTMALLCLLAIERPDVAPRAMLPEG